MARKLAVVAPSAPQSGLAILVEDYLASCRARGLSRSTVEKNYGYSLNEVFLPWAAKSGITNADELNQRLLDRFTAELLNNDGRYKPLSRDTVHSYVRPVRQFLSWAQKIGETTTSARPQLPKLERKVIDVLTRDEIDRLENAAVTERDKLMIRILADTGVRVAELCNLRAGDTTRHERGHLLKIRGKGGKHRLVPIRPELDRRIERFARARPAASDSDRIFLSLRRDTYGEYPPITTSGVAQMLANVADRAGITKRIYPHLLRHSFATEALRRGMNPVQLAQILGHSGLQMIDRVYSHLTVTDAYDAMMRMLATGGGTVL